MNVTIPAFIQSQNYICPFEGIRKAEVVKNKFDIPALEFKTREFRSRVLLQIFGRFSSLSIAKCLWVAGQNLEMDESALDVLFSPPSTVERTDAALVAEACGYQPK